jgi:hypothetical protein
VPISGFYHRLPQINVAVDAVRCEPFSACIPCSEQKRERALYPRHQIGTPPESDVISVSYPKSSVELMGRFCGSGAEFAIAIRENRLSFGGIALSFAGIGLHACGIRLRRRGLLRRMSVQHCRYAALPCR